MYLQRFFLAKRLLILAVCWFAGWGIVVGQQTGLPAQPDPDAAFPVEIPGSVPAPDVTPNVTPEPESLFVPVVPGSSPSPTPPPVDTPNALFEPSDIPAPAIQSTPETPSLFETEDPETVNALEEVDESYSTGRSAAQVRTAVAAAPRATPTPTPTPAPKRSYQPTSKKRASSATSTKPREQKSEGVGAALSGERLAQAMSRARASRDPKIAAQVGWAQFNRKDYPSAALWFEQAIAWDTGFGEAYYGLALTKFMQGDLSQAESIAGYRLKSYSKMPTLMADILVKRATEDYEDKQYASTINALDQASRFRKLSRSEQIIRGWSYYYLRDYASAANIFQPLYQASPDRPSAEGLYAALSRLKDWDRLAEIAGKYPGPLTEIYMTYDTEAYYKSGLFLAAYDANEEVIPALQNYDSPMVGLGFEYAQKSGQSGESQLQTVRTPVVEAKFSPAERVLVTAKAALLMLQSGSLSNGAFVGSPPLEFSEFERNIATGYNDLFEGKVRVEYQDWLTPYLEIGTTPLNASLDPRITGRAGVEYRHTSGYLKAEFYSQSIRESVLSYVGLEDPYENQAWGRVQETGGSLEVFQGFLKDYTVFGKAKYGVITGTNVEENSHLALTASVSRIFKPEGFEYIAVGPAVSYERYDNNQNFFTYGHGGYFSPEYIIQGIVEAQFLTKEGQNWLLSGSIGAGGQSNVQSSSPVLPLDPDGREYEGTSSTTGIFLVNGEGGFLLTPNIMVGSRLSYAITADYNEGFASIYLRYFFEPRAGLFRTDLGFSFW